MVLLMTWSAWQTAPFSDVHWATRSSFDLHAYTHHASSRCFQETSTYLTDNVRTCAKLQSEIKYLAFGAVPSSSSTDNFWIRPSLIIYQHRQFLLSRTICQSTPRFHPVLTPMSLGSSWVTSVVSVVTMVERLVDCPLDSGQPPDAYDVAAD